ncbi:hypothetical protein [Shewanella zhangzhouensis]|uniref:hypothetical protein n=1 Tax=Shewanella zhangzhouensis TaxID=2864213 RepID=UPI001C65E52B|nr:hypothetical protein [Shewanella zhangzhouensis]QYK06872.1 hypothetical protein K0H63_08780 [Shewanella zhangzhouensis]
MRQFRITKYNPIHRDSRGAYTLDEWTEYQDVGELVTLEEYEEVESSYIQSLILLLRSSKIGTFKIVRLENYLGKCPFQEGQLIDFEKFAEAFKSVLRSEYWCIFESEEAYVHFGYDFYSYIGVPFVDERDVNKIAERGLFVECCRSPFNERST